MAAVMQTARTTLSRYRWVAGALAIALIAVYVVLAVFSQPLSSDAEQLNRAPGQTTLVEDPIMAETNPPDALPPVLLSYVDGGESTLVKAIYNDGQTPFTITGVETSPSYWLGLVTLKDPRAAVMVGPGPCCELNDAATWSAPDFRSIQVNPKGWGVIALHLLMSNCEDNGPGGYEIIDTIKVDYSVLGFPRTEDVSVGPYWFQSPDTCPRSGPARP
jgi:hypothetical protein